MKIQVSNQPDDALSQLIDAGLEAHASAAGAAEAHLTPLQVSCRDAEGRLVGGLLGNTGNGWLHIWQLWVTADHRNQSVGTDLLRAAEEEAQRRGCRHAHLETLSFQALKFYLDRGYEEFGQLPMYVGAHSQHYLKKTFIG